MKWASSKNRPVKEVTLIVKALAVNTPVVKDSPSVRRSCGKNVPLCGLECLSAPSPALLELDNMSSDFGTV